MKQILASELDDIFDDEDIIEIENNIIYNKIIEFNNIICINHEKHNEDKSFGITILTKDNDAILHLEYSESYGHLVIPIEINNNLSLNLKNITIIDFFNEKILDIDLNLNKPSVKQTMINNDFYIDKNRELIKFEFDCLYTVFINSIDPFFEMEHRRNDAINNCSVILEYK